MAAPAAVALVAASTWAGAQGVGWLVRRLHERGEAPPAGKEGRQQDGAPTPTPEQRTSHDDDDDDDGSGLDDDSAPSSPPFLPSSAAATATPLPPGIVNSGATCFFNALLQALAVTPVAAHAAACVSWAGAALKEGGGGGEGGEGGEAAAAFPPALAPQLALLAELAAILGDLAPRAEGAASAPTPPAHPLSAARLLAAARAAAPPFASALAPATQHDAAEALDLLADAVAGATREVDRVARGGAAGPASPASSRPGSAPLPPPPPPPPQRPTTALAAALARRRARPASPGLSELLAAPALPGDPPPPPPGPPHPPRSPLAGALVFEGVCTACRAPREAAVMGFATLPLPIPVVLGPGGEATPLVRPGTRLEDCLRCWGGAEAVEGLECGRCTLRAALRGVEGGGSGGGEAPPPPPPPPPPRKQSAAARLRRLTSSASKKKRDGGGGGGGALDREGALARLRALDACPGPVPEAAAKAAVAAAGGVWAPVRRTALRRCLLARPPAVLALQLSRAVAAGGGGGGDSAGGGAGPAKAVGTIAFPLTLDVGPLTLAGAAPLLPPDSSSDGRPPLPPPAAAARPVLFDLAAVVEHGGARAARGHYTAWRRSGPAADAVWHRASDKRVAPASVEAALGAEAALLLYVRRAA